MAPPNFPRPPWNEGVTKNSSKSKRCRLHGNEHVQEGKFDLALEMYNGSLCYAPAESSDIPLIYGNRSAVFCLMGKYALALENINLARENGFPDEKMAQLNAREEKCMRLMEKFGPDQNSEARSFFQLSHPPNVKIPFIAGCLELHVNEKYGRHIITNKDLKAGEIIAIENPVFTWPNDSTSGPICGHCSTFNSGSLIPCSHCTKVMFCSKKCMEKSALHRFDDESNKAYSGELQESCKMMLEALTIAGGVNELLELLKGSEGKTIFDFDLSNPDDPDYDKNLLIALNGLWRKNWQYMNKSGPDDLLNIPPINEKPRTVEERQQLLKIILDQNRICSSNLTLFERSHYGIFLFKSLLNHACSPNIECVRYDEKAVLFVTRPIKAGGQLFDCYGFNAKTYPKATRLSKLKQFFGFNCDCEACNNKWPQDFPSKDIGFVEPKFDRLENAEAIEQFKKNCEYINENAFKMPSKEVSSLIFHNSFLAHSITGEYIEM